MKQLSIFMSIMILTLSFYKSSAQKLQYDKKFYHTIAPYEVFLQEEDLLIVKNYDIDSVLISEDFIKNKKYIKSLWHIRDGKKYEFQLFPTEKIQLFKTSKEFEYFLYENNFQESQMTFQGYFFIRILVSKKGKILDSRVILSPKGCIECRERVMKMLKKMKKITPNIYDKKVNSTTVIPIIYGKYYPQFQKK